MHDEKKNNELLSIFINSNKIIRNYKNIYNKLENDLKEYLDNNLYIEYCDIKDKLTALKLGDYKRCEICTKIIKINCKNKTCSKECNRLLYKKTLLEKYGPDHYKKVKELSEKTKLEKYGENYNKIFRDKAKKTMLEKYGVEYGGESKEFLEKAKQTSLDRYGVDNPMKSNIIKNKSISKVNKMKINLFYEKTGYLLNVEELNKLTFDLITDYTDEYFKYMKSYIVDGEIIPLNVIQENVSNSQFYINSKLYGHEFDNKSLFEQNVLEFIKSLNITNIITNTRKVIAPYEIDIFLPEYNLAIECDGIFYHSSKTIEDDKKYKMYHLNKTKMCEEQGIQLLHILDIEWNKDDKWKSLIRAKLNKNIKIFARKCDIKDVDNITAKEFCNQNHIQGYTNSSFNRGLFYNNELVMLSTFSRPRYTKDTSIKYELIRLCTLKNITVVGGASKLIKSMGCDIISYANKRWSYGNVYNKIGFEYIGDSKPCYWYYKNNKIFHRSSFMKHLLKEKLEYYDENLSESINMFNNNYLKYWDCGNMVFIYRYKENNENI